MTSTSVVLKLSDICGHLHHCLYKIYSVHTAFGIVLRVARELQFLDV